VHFKNILDNKSTLISDASAEEKLPGMRKEFLKSIEVRLNRELYSKSSYYKQSNFISKRLFTDQTESKTPNTIFTPSPLKRNRYSSLDGPLN
jgi:hypothetical protein